MYRKLICLSSSEKTTALALEVLIEADTGKYLGLALTLLVQTGLMATIFFLITSLAAGLAMVISGAIISYWVFGRTLKENVIAELAWFIQIGFAGPRPSDTDDLAAIRVLMAILGSGTDSRLYRMLSECKEDEVSATGAFGSYRAEQVRLIIYAMEMSDSETVSRILDEVERVKTEPPDARELERAKESVIGRFALRMQRNSDKASSIARDHFLGLPIDCCDTYIADTEAVTAEQVRAVAERYLVNPAIVFQRAGNAPARRGI